MMQMYPKIINAKLNGDYQLMVTFNNNIVKKLNFLPKLSEPRFEALNNKTLFDNFQIDQGGYGISWNNEIDISEYEAWTNGELIN